MGITTNLTMDTRLTVRARSASRLDTSTIDRIKTDRTGDIANQALWSAQVAGDRPAIRTIAANYLSSTSNAPTGIGRERWFLVGAAAHADRTVVASIADLLVWLDEMYDGLTLMQIAAVDFGARRVGTLEAPAALARQRIADTKVEVEALVHPGQAKPWKVVRTLSFFGDFFLSSAVSRALFVAGDEGNAEVVRAAHLHRVHGHPEAAIEVLDEVLSKGIHPWALNAKAAALGKLAQFTAAANLTLLSVAVQPNDYTGNTGRTAFRNIGRHDLSRLSDEIAHRYRSCSVPLGFQGTAEQYVSVLAASLLQKADRRDLAELQLLRQRTTAEWARLTREALDLGSTPTIVNLVTK